MSRLRASASSALVALTLGAALLPGPTAATSSPVPYEPRDGDRLHVVVDHGLHPHLPTTTTTTATTTATAATAPRSKVATTRKAYRSAVAAERKALKKLNDAVRAKRNAHRAWLPAQVAADDADAAHAAQVRISASVAAQLTAAESHVAVALDELATALTSGDEAAIAKANGEVARTGSAVTRLQGALAAAQRETSRLATVRQGARRRLADVEAATRVSTTRLSVTHDRAKKRTFTTRVRLARVSTPASTTRAPYSLLGKGKKVWFWDACSGPITVRVSTPALSGNAKKAAVAEARRMVAVAKKSSRLPLSFRGTTAETPTLTSQVKSADIVISYTSPRHSPGLGLGSNTLGMGGSWSRTTERGANERRAGFAAIDVTSTSARRDGRSPQRATVVLHELGHALGLNHVSGRGQLMYPSASASTPSRWGKGDRNGLKRLRAYSRC